MTNFNIVEMTQAFSENKETIQLYFSNPEMFSDEDKLKEARIMGLAVGIFVFVYLLMLVIFAWSLYAIIRYWKRLPLWAIVLSIVFLFIFPIFSLVIVYGSVDTQENVKSKKSRD
jgi:fatty acid desaturase